MHTTSNGVFQGDNPLDYALPLAILQIVLVVALTRILAFLLRPLRQPRVIAETAVSNKFFFSLLYYINLSYTPLKLLLWTLNTVRFPFDAFRYFLSTVVSILASLVLTT